MKKVWGIGLIVLILVVLFAFDFNPSAKLTKMATPVDYMHTFSNPAAVYCQSVMGYQYKTINAEQGSYGMCVFPDESRCDAWDFYAGTCGTAFSWCEQNGFTTHPKTDGRDGISPHYAVCTSAAKGEIGNVSDLSGTTDQLIHPGCVETNPSQQGTQLVFDPAPLVIDKIDLQALPTSFDWRNVDGGDWMTSVKDQGQCGSCWAFSAIGVAEAVHNISANNPTLDLDLSEQYLVSDCVFTGSNSQTCCGGSKASALYYIRDNGVPDEGCFPYVDGGGCSCYDSTCDEVCTYRTPGYCSDTTCNDRCADYSSRLSYVEAARYISSTTSKIDAMKQTLVEVGPIATSIGIGSSFGGYFDGNGVYRCTNDSSTNHAVIITGYDSVGQYWIIKNSWGSTWNGDGYLKMGFGECAVEVYPYIASNLPLPFYKNAPLDESVDWEESVTLSWGSTVGLDWYEFCVDTTDNDICDQSWVNFGLSTSVGLTNLEYGTTYYWQVRAVNSYGTQEADHAWWQFSTVDPPPPPENFEKLSPTNNLPGVELTPTLSWESSTGAGSYEYCIDTTDDDNCSLWIDNGLNTSVHLNGLERETTYYWQVRAVNDGGTTYADGNSGSDWFFTTIINPPAAFQKIFPVNQSTEIAVTPVLSWEESTGAESYQYCIDQTNDNDCSNWVSNGSNLSTQVTNLEKGTTYYWHVRAVNDGGFTYADGGADHFWQFTTLFEFVYLPLVIR